MIIRKGEDKVIPIELYNNGEALLPEAVEKAVFNIGPLEKYWPGDVLFYEGKWLLPITQNETLGIAAGMYTAEARIKLKSGEIEGVTFEKVSFVPMQNKEVL